MKAPTIRNTIRTFALVCVAVTSTFIMGMIVWSTVLLAQPDWCERALGAVKESEGFTRPEFAVSGCFSLLNSQVRSLAFNSHVYAGVIALCLLTLMVIVVAGGKLSFTAGPKGASANIGKEIDPVAAAAEEVADAAVEAADEFKGDA